MNVFFLSSVDDSNLRKSYKDIIKILKSCGNKVTANHSLTTPQKIESLTQKNNEVRAKKLVKEMLKTDCVVFEGTKPTTGGGYYISIALQKSLPVLYLAQEEYKGLYLASSNRLLRIKKYYPSDLIQLKNTIQDFLKFTHKKRLSKRFNLMVSDTMIEFLSKVTKDYGISKADFIRNLVYREMEKS